MKKLDYPEIKKFTDLKSFIEETVKKNIKRNPEISYRWFSKQLDWPTSLFSDFLSGRRDLTISRLIEFANLIQLDSVDIEYLIFLSFKDHKEAAVSKIFSQELDNKRSASQKGEEIKGDEHLFIKPETGVILALLSWTQKLLSPKQIKEMLFTFPELTIDEIKKILEFLKKEKLFEEDEVTGKLSFDIKVFELNYSKLVSLEKVNLFEPYLENSQRFLCSEKKQGPGYFTQRFQQIPLENIDEIKKRLDELQNIILSFDKDNIPNNSKRLFQFGITLFPIVDEEVWNNL